MSGEQPTWIPLALAATAGAILAFAIVRGATQPPPPAPLPSGPDAACVDELRGFQERNGDMRAAIERAQSLRVEIEAAPLPGHDRDAR
jgi:hypothetical protein